MITWDRLMRWLALVAVGAALGIGFMALRQRARPAPIEILPAPTVAPAAQPTAAPAAVATAALRVYVTGSVMAPAVYELPPEAIIDDAVRAAGGFTVDADRVAVNLAQPLSDGVHVHVPALGETAAPPPVVVGPAPTAVPARSGGLSLSLEGLININTATALELEALPGIGPSTAEKIIAHREANGPFAAIEAIMDVPGIGEGKFEEIKGLITVGP